ncbi:uncharacterized protein MONOS_4222 [Monocercomonoides exilis]|uniref:uncharacterized protein n=1 Tax=Monocercomonoides exilis TaxID=2049356 RepID=UPI00355986B2|nr:hypothetical protein MONOS_4222 [Monocercomonoides exilis]
MDISTVKKQKRATKAINLINTKISQLLEVAEDILNGLNAPIQREIEKEKVIYAEYERKCKGELEMDLCNIIDRFNKERFSVLRQFDEQFGELCFFLQNGLLENEIIKSSTSMFPSCFISACNKVMDIGLFKPNDPSLFSECGGVIENLNDAANKCLKELNSLEGNNKSRFRCLKCKRHMEDMIDEDRNLTNGIYEGMLLGIPHIDFIDPKGSILALSVENPILKTKKVISFSDIPASNYFLPRSPVPGISASKLLNSRSQSQDARASPSKSKKTAAAATTATTRASRSSSASATSRTSRASSSSRSRSKSKSQSKSKTQSRSKSAKSSRTSRASSTSRAPPVPKGTRDPYYVVSECFRYFAKKPSSQLAPRCSRRSRTSYGFPFACSFLTSASPIPPVFKLTMQRVAAPPAPPKRKTTALSAAPVSEEAAQKKLREKQHAALQSESKKRIKQMLPDVDIGLAIAEISEDAFLLKQTNEELERELERQELKKIKGKDKINYNMKNVKLMEGVGMMYKGQIIYIGDFVEWRHFTRQFRNKTYGRLTQVAKDYIVVESPDSFDHVFSLKELCSPGVTFNHEFSL